MSFSYASVVEATHLNPRLRRITLQVDDPAALDVKPGGDSAVAIYFPTGRDGARVDPQAADAEARNYSVRSHDGDRIVVDVVLHARGVATTWAAGAAAGDRVGLDHARSWYRPAPDTAWQLLVADMAGLPALARIIDELPGEVPVTAIVEVADEEDLDYLPTAPGLTVVRRVGSGNGHGTSELAATVRAQVLPEGKGYCWFAGEAAESRAVRKYLRGAGWTVDQLDVTGYWRFDSEVWDTKFALVADEVVAVWERAVADGKSERVADEEFDEALERAGL
ncbi:siderophore-interacting protein [Mycolicibacterium bacteremicum]|uniref:siderophore-interacting protein n=1 Tax=Mycolicibacterium bacteremicum TaxID=564198 RepID=UPI0026EA9611|nr:siderophore-interacting protein [Mycolicibacterium bacteremicum]